MGIRSGATDVTARHVMVDFFPAGGLAFATGGFIGSSARF
jgi:hypothetical protein